jgi:hypothetical protein
MARGVSSPAGDDKGSSPLTSAAFLKNCCTKKLLILSLPKIDFRIKGTPSLWNPCSNPRYTLQQEIKGKNSTLSMKYTYAIIDKICSL